MTWMSEQAADRIGEALPNCPLVGKRASSALRQCVDAPLPLQAAIHQRARFLERALERAAKERDAAINTGGYRSRTRQLGSDMLTLRL